MRLLRGIFFAFIIIHTTTAQDTLTLHYAHLDRETVLASVDFYKAYEAEQALLASQTKKGKPCFVRFIKNQRLVEQGFFFGQTPCGNHVRYDENGKIVYKKLYLTLPTIKGQSIDFGGSKATEEMYDGRGYKIFGTYVDGLKQGRWLYYDNRGNIIGCEDFDKGLSTLQKGRIFTPNSNGQFDVALR